MKNNLDISIIIPVYNEEDSISIMCFSLKKTIEELNKSYEIIFVDDGSSDKSLIHIKELVKSLPEVILIPLTKHEGKSIALQAGFDHARGNTIVTIDGDLQYDIHDIPVLLQKLEEGFDIVIGWRKYRKDSLIKKLASVAGNTIRKAATGDKFRDAGCNLMAIKNHVIKNIRLKRGLHRFFSTIASRSGYKICEVPVNHNKRKFGRSKYGILDRFFEGTVDLMSVCLFDTRSFLKETTTHEIKRTA